MEHSRIYVFGEGDDAQVFLASSDWMPRNFYRRVEAMFPIEAPELRQRILNEIVPAYLRDNVKARILRPDGSHYRLEPTDGEARYRVQEELLSLRPELVVGDSDFSGNGALVGAEAALPRA